LFFRVKKKIAEFVQLSDLPSPTNNPRFGSWNRLRGVAIGNLSNKKSGEDSLNFKLVRSLAI